MNGRRRIYLDNAATSWPKPTSVYEAVCQYMRQNGAALGRGVYLSAQEVGRTIATLRRRAASMLGVASPSRILFTFNGTDSLNLALHGILRPGDHVVTTTVEHNSVLRPLQFLQRHRDVRVTYVECDGAGFVHPQRIAEELKDNTRLVAICHASNVTGSIQPVCQILAAVASHPALRLLDAAQTAGHLPLLTDSWGLDLVACSGHKGLLGPLGTGLLAVSERAAQQLFPLREGGTGTFSESDEQPDTLPDRFESGNLNVPGLVGLERGIAYIEERGVQSLRAHEIQLTSRFLQALRNLPGITIYGPQCPEAQVGVVSFRLDGYDPQELAALLDAEFGIEVRGGLHCAPRLHRRLGTLHRGGTVRASFGPFNTPEDVDALVEALERLSLV